VLTHTFCHLPGIGPATEKSWWTQGLLTWEEFLNTRPSRMSAKRHQILATELETSMNQLDAGNAAYFAARLPKAEMWRLFASFDHTLAYVDIETTGGMNGLDHITTIAAYDRRQVHTFVHGHNLEKVEDFFTQPQLLITYNGSCFDLPYLHREMVFPGPAAHIDLRFLLASVGLRGGLKGCERQLGLDRGELDGFDGYLAVLLWHNYQTLQDIRYLHTLLRYNCEDVINLDLLMTEAWNRKLAQLPPTLSHLTRIWPERFPNPYPRHPEILDAFRPAAF
jgi:hypothetical protein